MQNKYLLVLITIIAFFLGLITISFYSPNYRSSKTPIELTVNTGSSLNSVIELLYSKKVILNKTLFKVTAYILGEQNKIKAGEYILKDGLSYIEIIDKLTKGTGLNQKLVTIPEGIWMNDLAKILKEKLKLDSNRIMTLSTDKAFIKSLGLDIDNLEGYLLPNTYYFFTNSTEEDVLRKLYQQSEKLFTNEVNKRLIELKMSKHEILTLASIIDGESNKISEFARISGVYHNRLKDQMALQACPTVQFIIREQRPTRILYKHLAIESPYNTYLNTGLPPSPINNPGKEAIMAALYPEEHDYLYFVADGKGNHTFSKTYTEHNKNADIYRQYMDY